MTIKEKLKLMEEIRKVNRERVKQFIEKEQEKKSDEKG